MRSALAKHDPKAISVALRRATHLASDLALEQVETEDVTAAVRELVTRGVLEDALAGRVAARLAAGDDREEPFDERIAVERARDLDRLLRSLEHGAPMPELPFTALDTPEAPAAESRAAVTVSGRHVVVGGRGGEGLVFVDERPVGRPFPMVAAPTSKADIQREASGRTRIAWDAEGLVVELGADLASATVLAPA
jgi:hypothetical protein